MRVWNERNPYSPTVLENVNRRCLKKWKAELPYDLAILLLGVCLKELNLLAQKHIYALMFITALITKATVGKKEALEVMLSTDESRKKIWSMPI